MHLAGIGFPSVLPPRLGRCAQNFYGARCCVLSYCELMGRSYQAGSIPC